MKYSIIIAVYNRLGEVKELLGSAEKLAFDKSNYELFFVDDGSTDGFKKYINEYKTKSDLNIQAIYQQNKGPGAARNNGMEHATGQYFIFVDSDCMFPPHWLKEIDNQLLTHDYDAFGGPDTTHPSFSPLIKAINYSMTSFLGTGGTRGGKKSIGKFYPRSFNMGIKREVFDTIGGMNALRHGQDMDFSMRIYDAGFKVGLIPSAYVYHKRRTSLYKFFKQIFNWGVARINLGAMHKEMLKPVHFFPTIIVVAYLLLIIISFFSNFFLKLLLVTFVGHLSVSLLAFLQSFIQYKSFRVSFLSVITLNIQVFAYGFGLLWALIQKLFGKKEALGFVKNYYGKKKN